MSNNQTKNPNSLVIDWIKLSSNHNAIKILKKNPNSFKLSY
jgi:hypothetical protein